jgi:hypothetical protein
LSALCPNCKPEYHPLSALRDCLFNTFAATHHNWGLCPLSTWYGDMDPFNTDIERRSLKYGMKKLKQSLKKKGTACLKYIQKQNEELKVHYKEKRYVSRKMA